MKTDMGRNRTSSCSEMSVLDIICYCDSLVDSHYALLDSQEEFDRVRWHQKSEHLSSQLSQGISGEFISPLKGLKDAKTMKKTFPYLMTTMNFFLSSSTNVPIFNDNANTVFANDIPGSIQLHCGFNVIRYVKDCQFPCSMSQFITQCNYDMEHLYQMCVTLQFDNL